MGTRADFYTGTDPATMVYLGSIAYDGGDIEEVGSPATEQEYRDAVGRFIASRDDGSTPDRDGWPWPWNTSATTDCAYTWDGERILSAHGSPERWLPHPWHGDDDELPASAPQARFPNMEGIKRVTLGRRSGVLVLGVPG